MFRSREDFLARYTSSSGELYIQGHDDLAVDAEVRLDVHLIDTGVSMGLNGSVVWRRTKAGSPKPGIGVRFATEDHGKRDLLIAFAQRRDGVSLHQRARRYPSSQAIRIRIKGRSVETHLGNISEGGAFVLLPRHADSSEFRPGEPVELTIEGPDPIMPLLGRIRWKSQGPNAGFGMEFSAHTGRRLLPLLKELRAA
ncbi:MAG: PilZ domain-containing protein [Myxococcota bacterium]